MADLPVKALSALGNVLVRGVAVRHRVVCVLGPLIARARRESRRARRQHSADRQRRCREKQGQSSMPHRILLVRLA